MLRTRRKTWQFLFFDWSFLTLVRLISPFALRPFERRFLRDDVGRLRRHLRIQCDKWFPFFRHVVLMENRVHGTLRYACFAVDTLLGMNVKELLAFVEAFHRADDDTARIFTVEAQFTNDVGHGVLLAMANDKEPGRTDKRGPSRH